MLGRRKKREIRLNAGNQNEHTVKISKFIVVNMDFANKLADH